ncbi:hypothetical protein [Tabrizicola sp.]|uniref:hypothetical protein n=1 Tax=Tabrizicola sp. TaxID=2005166 RepID=UPI003F36351B
MTISRTADHHRLSARGIDLGFDPDCGFICDLTVHDEGRSVQPMHRVPWIGETLPSDTSPHLHRMQGDFFCAPFADGGGTAPIPHGWPANAFWSITAHGPQMLEARLVRDVEGATVTKKLTLQDGHPFVYQSHRLDGGSGTLSVANHAMVTLPDGGLISFSPKTSFRTPSQPPESDPACGRSALAYPAIASDPRAFPAADGGTLDLTRYPFRPGHEDFVVATEAPGSPLGWTAVVRLGRGDLYLSLHNPAQLPMTMLWHSDGGRDYAPWSGRHRACLGVEEGFAPHMLGEEGGLALGGSLDIRHAIGCIAWPSEARVTQVAAAVDSLTVTGETGESRSVPFDLSHLFP